MNSIFEQLSQYGFHDAAITKIHRSGATLSLFFSNGLYKLAKTGQELELTGSMIVRLTIETRGLPLDWSINVF